MAATTVGTKVVLKVVLTGVSTAGMRDVAMAATWAGSKANVLGEEWVV